MDKRPIKTIRELEGFKKRLRKHMAVQKIILFGSTARGKAGKDSDIDLILISPKFKGVSPLKRAYMVSRHWSLDCPKDFLCYTQEEFEKIKLLSVVVKEAVREGVEI